MAVRSPISGRAFAEGDKDRAQLLGGKGANLAEMSSLGLPVSPGFTITTEACPMFRRRPKSAPAAASSAPR